MKSDYCVPHSALATKQNRRAELDAIDAPSHHQNHSRRHFSAGAATCAPASSRCGAYSRSGSPSKSTSALSNEARESLAASSEAPQKTLPDRTAFDAEHVHFDDDGRFNANAGDSNTKDCVDYACAQPSPLPDRRDEPDHLQQRFSGIQHSTGSSSREHMPPPRPYDAHNSPDACAVSSDGGCASGQSSVISSPSPSTVSSPLSTPTRLSPHLLHHLHRQHCCQKPLSNDQQSASGGGGGAAATLSSLASGSQQHQHLHHHLHHAHSHLSPGSTAGCKKSQKLDPRLSPSPYRQLLPIVLCILSFATVFSTLMVYMDTTEIRHQQFRLNMSRDDDLYGVAQDDPTLIAFLRQIHMRKYPVHFAKNAREATSIDEQRLNFSGNAHNELAPQMAHYVADLVGGRMNGAVIQSLSGSLGQLMTAQWLSETLNWAGIIVEPEPRRYFTLRKQNAHRSRMQVLHACVSPKPYPKEVTIHNEEPEVRINSLYDEETSWFNSRVKCFPLYTIMLACNRVEYDLLSLGVHGHELEMLQTLPFDKIIIEVISIHLPDSRENAREYIQAITKFLATKSYKFQRKFGRNYFYQRINKTGRTRKRDILLLKAP